jgi:hypothetical protein
MIAIAGYYRYLSGEFGEPVNVTLFTVCRLTGD